MILLDEFRSYPLTCAIVEVLEEEGKPLHYKVITDRINTEKGTDYPSGTVNSYCSQGTDFGLFEREDRGIYALAGTTVTAPHSHKAVGGKVSVDVRPCALYDSDNPAYKKASSFIDSPVPSQDEKDLLELIVNFQLGLVSEAVCFADILNDLEVVFSDEDKKRDQDIDKDLLEEKLNELKKKIKKIERKAKLDQTLEALLARMKSAKTAIEDILDEASGDIVKIEVSLLGKFIPGKGEEKPKVVISQVCPFITF